MIVTLRPAAEEDLDDAAQWYEGHSRGLGGEFLDEVQRVIGLIEDNPQSYPRIHGEIYRAMIRRFPFGMFYVLEGETAVVLAIIHASRDPNSWKIRT
ncbi:MAG: type II toxin-antitoxin system RelE/ParE family toxin [Chloroflexi bacterium]|nr:type II toxin-antitoxin system RelE/ParE family toxin [Chloroflexota bacterium]